MNIKFKHIYLKNFFSFEEANIDLTYTGYTLISGINNNREDMASSNGCGKSTIGESIIWCLTGETIRGTKQVVNQTSSSGTKVELLFSINEDEYKIIRYKDDLEYGNNLKIYINNQDKSGKGIRDTEKLLEEYLPDLNAQLLGSVIILGQGLPQRFTNNTPAGRKEVLEKLSKSDFMIQDIKDKLSIRRSDLNNQLRKYEDSLLQAESKLSILNNELKKLEEDHHNLFLKDWEKEINITDSNIKEQEKIINQINTELNTSNESLLSIKQKINDLDVILSENQLQINKELTDSIIPIHKLNIEYKYKIKDLEEKISNAKNIKDICPTCGQKLPDVHKIDTTDLEKELTQLNDTLTKSEAQERDYNQKANDKLKNFENLYKERKAELNKEYEIYLTKYNEIKINFDSCTNLLSELKIKKELLINEQYNFTINKEKIEKNIELTKNEIDSYNKDLLYNNNEINITKDHLEVINKMITIATRDFRGFLLSEIINFINLKSKEYAQEIFETDKINFSLDGNNINISYLDKQYENLSGGEKQKIDLIIQFSIRDMLSQYLSFSSNILMLDEIFDNLDDIGCQKVLNLISNKLTDIESIYIITHHSDISIPVDRYLLIIKDNEGISRIQ